MVRRLLAALILASLATPAGAARTGLACLAPTDPADAGKPLQDVAEIEFYLDDGNPLNAYTVPFVRLTHEIDAEGGATNSYALSVGKEVAATLRFASGTLLTFALAADGHTYDSLVRNDKETAFMADAVPGIVCWTVALSE